MKCGQIAKLTIVMGWRNQINCKSAVDFPPKALKAHVKCKNAFVLREIGRIWYYGWG